MMIREQIEEKLRAAFQPVFLEVVDESYRHNVPAGSESHFKVVLVSDRFTGERFLNRHRMIYSTLTVELSTTVHALALHTYTIKEWKRCRIRFLHRLRVVGREASRKNGFATTDAFPVCCYRLCENGLRAVLFCLNSGAVVQYSDKN